MKKKLITILMAMAITKAQAEKWLEKVDAPDEAEVDENKIIADFGEKVKELMKNDPDFIKSIQTAEAAKRNDMWRAKIKRETGLTAEDIKDKSDEEIVKMAVEKVRKKGDVTNEQLQAENVALAAENKKLKEEELPGAHKKADERIKAINNELALEKAINSLPKKLRVGNIAALATLKQKMGGKYTYEVDDTGKLVIKTSDGLAPKSADGTKLLTPEDLIAEILDGEKLLENSGGGGEGGGGGTGGGKKNADGTIVTGDEKKDDLYKRFPNLKASEEHAAKVKADLEARKAASAKKP